MIKKNLDYESAKADRVDKQKTLQEFADIAKESMKNVSKIIEPIEALIKQMDKDDKVYLGDKIYSKQEAEKHFSSPEDSELVSSESIFQIDGEFDITDVSLENGNVSVKKDGKKYKLITRLLPTSQKNKLHKMYRVCSIANTYPKNIPLQINLIVQDGEWIEAHICGLGKPRSGAISIEKALQLSIPKERRVLQQGSLLDI